MTVAAMLSASLRLDWCSLFIECVDGTGTMEWNTVNDTLVRWHTNAIGAITGAPADDMVFVSDSGNSSVTMIKPKGASNLSLHERG